VILKATDAILQAGRLAAAPDIERAA
jgi:hypothetical protein